MCFRLFFRTFAATMKICVFCSANERIDRDFFRMTEELGRWMAREGHVLVYGGVNQGLMECIGRAVHEAGGRTIGVIPRIVEKRGGISEYVDVELLCDDLSDRKQLMESQSDVFVALPGGIGTLDEVFTVAASATIGYHRKRVVVYNMKGYWEGLVSLLDGLEACGMVRGRWQDYVCVAESLEEVVEALNDE